MTLPLIGEKAPDFELPDQNAKTHRLSDYKGKKVLLYFYPKDDTPGCTVQACDFRDHKKEFDQKGITIIGISPDDALSHKKFEQKYGFAHTILADADALVAKQYGAFGPKQFMGKHYEGIVRSTFLIDGKGMISKVFSPVKPEGHWEEAYQSF